MSEVFLPAGPGRYRARSALRRGCEGPLVVGGLRGGRRSLDGQSPSLVLAARARLAAQLAKSPAGLAARLALAFQEGDPAAPWAVAQAVHRAAEAEALGFLATVCDHLGEADTALLWCLSLEFPAPPGSREAAAARAAYLRAGRRRRALLDAKRVAEGLPNL